MAFDLALTGIGAVDPSGGAAKSGLSGAVAEAEGMSFAEALKNVAGDAMTDLKAAETISLDALSGKADTRQVADAVMSAEQSLQAAIAIRDKIVSAYLEISRMQI
jgi:flagellar hook-basal body complex protein FliE